MHGELFALERGMKILHQPFGKRFFFKQGIIVDANRSGKAVFYGICGQLGPVKAPFDLNAPVHIEINAHA